MARTSPSPAERFMLQALRLAQRGQGYVEPNPMVGAVLVRGGRIVARGWHQRFGGPHAEVRALEDAKRRGIDPAGCDLYVSLEPCCHHGKTPPCTDAVIAARVARVVAAMIDPFPQVAGQGAARLRQAGLTVETGVCEEQARQLNEPFLKRVAAGRAWVIAKWAQTLDGRIATRAGDSKWISSGASRHWVHRLRGRVDAVVVGIGTVLADDPLLTARGVKVRRTARRVVVDPDLRLPPRCKLLASLAEPGAAPLIIAVRRELIESPSATLTELRQRGVEFVGLPPLPSEGKGWGEGPSARPTFPDDAGPSLDLAPLLDHLTQHHAATNILVEGGSRLLGAMLAQGLIDQVLAFVAPRLLADGAAVPALTGRSCPALADANTLTLRTIQRLGDDVLLDYRLAPPPPVP